MQKNIVCDSSALISLADTCNISSLNFLSQRGLNFIVTPAVRAEIVSRPLTIRKYAFSAVRLQKSLAEGSLKLISSHTLNEQTKKILEVANSLIYVANKPLDLIQLGEAECLAIFASASAKALLIDEKTTRMLIESPMQLKDTIESEYRQKATVDKSRLEEFSKLTQGITCLRSSELLAFALKQGFFDEYGQNKREAFVAAVYSLREAGCGLTSAEIVEYEKMETG